MSVLYPTYLWCFLGLFLPILIHFWSKKQNKTIKVGSIEFIEPTKSNRASSIHLNEWILLLLRVLLLSILILILSGLQLNKKISTKDIAYFVEPSLQSIPEMQSFMDSLQKEESIYSFEMGFPQFSLSQSKDTVARSVPYWQLAQDLEQFPSDSLVVFTQGLLKNIKGKRPDVSRNIKWIQIEKPKELFSIPVFATQSDKGIILYEVKTNASQTSFEKKLITNEGSKNFNIKGDSVVFSNSKRKLFLDTKTEYVVGLKTDDSLISQRSYIEASLSVISEFLNKKFSIKKISGVEIPEDLDILFWLSKEQPPATEAVLIDYQPDPFAKNILAKKSEKKYVLTGLINSQNSIKDHFTETLLESLAPSKKIIENIKEIDQRSIALGALQPNYKLEEKNTLKLQKFDLRNYLWIILIVILIVERILSKLRVQ